MTTEIEKTYAERAQTMTAEARAELTRLLVDKFNQFKSHAAIGQKAAILGVNTARDIGELIQVITGHEKLLAHEFNQLALALPDAGIAFAKECLSVRNATPSPVTDYAAAKPIWDKLLVQLELLPKSKRELAQPAPPKFEPVEDFLCDVASLASKYARLEKDAPVEKWKPYYRQTFCFEFSRLAAIHDKILSIGNV